MNRRRMGENRIQSHDHVEEPQMVVAVYHIQPDLQRCLRRAAPPGQQSCERSVEH